MTVSTSLNVIDLAYIEPSEKLDAQDLLIRLSKQSALSSVIEIILDEAMTLTKAEGGTFYLVSEEKSASFLEFALAKNRVLDFYVNTLSSPPQSPLSLERIPLKLENGGYSIRNVATYAALTRSNVNIEDVYKTDRFDFAGTKKFDQQSGYYSKSFLTIPLTNSRKEVIGILQLINAHEHEKEVCFFSKEKEEIVSALASYAAIALSNHLLNQEYKNLWDSFIQCIAQLIDAKSKHTAKHCQRVPYIMNLMVEAGCLDNEVLQSFDLSEDEKYEIKVASWLHDCGKLATPDFLLNKATKLEKLIDCIDIIELKFDLLIKEEKIKILSMPYQHPLFLLAYLLGFEAKKQEWLKALQTLKKVNMGGEFLKEEEKNIIKNLSLIALKNEQGEKIALISPEEVAVLCIERGTLSHDERTVINQHINISIDLLESLPFPKRLKRVAEIAGGHHEKVDGTGYPKKLKGEQMSIPAKMMAVADIFEALTSEDRPYKEAMKMSQALGILKRMRDQHHIDQDIYQLFLRYDVWKDYGQAFMQPAQMDVADISAYY